MTFEGYKAEVARIEEARRAAQRKLLSLGAGSGPRGLTPDHIKFSPEYREAVVEHRRTWDALRKLNKRWLPVFRSELARQGEAKMRRTMGQ